MEPELILRCLQQEALRSASPLVVPTFPSLPSSTSSSSSSSSSLPPPPPPSLQQQQQHRLHDQTNAPAWPSDSSRGVLPATSEEEHKDKETSQSAIDPAITRLLDSWMPNLETITDLLHHDDDPDPATAAAAAGAGAGAKARAGAGAAPALDTVDAIMLHSCEAVLDKLQESLQSAVDSLEDQAVQCLMVMPQQQQDLRQRTSAVHNTMKEITAGSQMIDQEVQRHLNDARPFTQAVSALDSKIAQIQTTRAYLDAVQRAEEMAPAVERLADDIAAEWDGIKQNMLNNEQKRKKKISETALADAAEKTWSCSSLTQIIPLVVEMADQVRYLQKHPGCQLGIVLLERIQYVVKRVRQPIAARFSGLLRAIGWPRSRGGPFMDLSPERLADFARLCDALIQLQLASVLAGMDAETCVSPLVYKCTSSDDADSQASMSRLWIVELAVSPLAKRFLFHFDGGRPTNRLDKPEWFLKFVQDAVSDHVPLLSQHAQRIVTAACAHAQVPSCDTVANFMGMLMQLAVRKLRANLIRMSDGAKPLTFRHTIDEVLLFEEFMRDTHHFPVDYPGCIDVLTSDEIFDRWIAIDKEWVNDRLEALRDMKSPWQPLSSNVDGSFAPSNVAALAAAGSMRVQPTRSADAFITLVTTVSSRAKLIRKLKYRLRFFHDIQIKLLTIYRDDVEDAFYEGQRRLHLETVDGYGKNAQEQDVVAQKVDEVWAEHCGLLSSLHFVESAIGEWSELPRYLEILYYGQNQEQLEQLAADAKVIVSPTTLPMLGSQLEAGEQLQNVSGSLFDVVISEYQSLKNHLLDGLVDFTVSQFMHLSAEYRSRGFVFGPNNASSMGANSSVGHKLEVSPLISGALATLKLRMILLDQHLGNGTVLFRRLWSQLSSRLDDAMYQSLIADRHFSPFGARQLAHDLSAFFMSFKAYAASPSNYFKRLKESCVLLSLDELRINELSHVFSQFDVAQTKVVMDNLRIRTLSVDQVRGLISRIARPEQTVVQGRPLQNAENEEDDGDELDHAEAVLAARRAGYDAAAAAAAAAAAEAESAGGDDPSPNIDESPSIQDDNIPEEDDVPEISFAELVLPEVDESSLLHERRQAQAEQRGRSRRRRLL